MKRTRSSLLHAELDRIRLARTLIEMRYDTGITLDELARTAGFSPYHFIRIFRHVYKQTPHECIVARRIEQAKYLLRASTMPITEICFEVGFQSLGSFSAMFRKAAGLSPSSYRDHSAPLPSRADIPMCYRIRYDVRDPEEI